MHLRKQKKSLNAFSALTVTLFIFTACSYENKKKEETEESKLTTRVIYGDDDRKDLYQVQDAQLLAVAESTVALMESSKLRVSGDRVTIQTESYKSAYNLCADEPFVNQNLAAFCSGSLVGKDLIITAGHCVTVSDCSSKKFVFGFGVKQEGQLPSEVSVNDVYGCKAVVKRELQNNVDYALIKLDREVVNRKPLKIKRGSAAVVGAPLTVIGHPSGLPTKVASGGRIRSVNDIFYVTNLDTYGGNSGSAVFDSTNLEVVGILVRGEEDYVRRGNCNVSNRCESDKCRGEDVTKISLLESIIPELDTEEPPPEEPNEVVFESSPNLSIPDRNLTGVLAAIEVPELPAGRKVLVEVDIDHTYVGDLQITLLAPNGKSYLLRKNKGGRQQNLAGVFGDTLPTETSLVELSDLQVSGKYSLKVVDSISRDVGVLKKWKIILR